MPALAPMVEVMRKEEMHRSHFSFNKASLTGLLERTTLVELLSAMVRVSVFVWMKLGVVGELGDVGRVDYFVVVAGHFE